MSGPWALRVEGPPARLVARLGPLRLAPGVVGCVVAEDGVDGACVDAEPAAGVLARAGACTSEVVVWLRGETLDPDLDRRLRATGGARFVVDPDGALRAPGRRLPAGRLPRGPWRPLAALLAPTAPAASAPAPAARAGLRLVRGGSAPADEPGALLVATATLVAWALGAPQVRLAPLEVAARADAGEALVRGRPLPPLPGTRLVVRDGVAVPAGLTLAPALDPPALEALLDLAPGDLGVLAGEGDDPTLERVPAAAFAPLTRALARTLARSPGRSPEE